MSYIVESIDLSLSWSGGKDSAFALWCLLQDKRCNVVSLHTTFGQETRRVGMHGISQKLVEAQALSIGIPLDRLYYPASGDNKAYESAMETYLDQLDAKGIHHVAYGDIFLEDLKLYRENQLQEKGFQGIFPLWKKKTPELSMHFLQAGFKTKICAVDGSLIDSKWIGKDYDEAFLASLPASVDPCGENGEFHTFCYEGPVFNYPLTVRFLEVLEKKYTFQDEHGEEISKKYWFASLDLD